MSAAYEGRRNQAASGASHDISDQTVHPTRPGETNKTPRWVFVMHHGGIDAAIKVATANEPVQREKFERLVAECFPDTSEDATATRDVLTEAQRLNASAWIALALCRTPMFLLEPLLKYGPSNFREPRTFEKISKDIFDVAIAALESRVSSNSEESFGRLSACLCPFELLGDFEITDILESLLTHLGSEPSDDLIDHAAFCDQVAAAREEARILKTVMSTEPGQILDIDKLLSIGSNSSDEQENFVKLLIETVKLGGVFLNCHHNWHLRKQSDYQKSISNSGQESFKPGEIMELYDLTTSEFKRDIIYALNSKYSAIRLEKREKQRQERLSVRAQQEKRAKEMSETTQAAFTKARHEELSAQINAFFGDRQSVELNTPARDFLDAVSKTPFLQKLGAIRDDLIELSRILLNTEWEFFDARGDQDSEAVIAKATDPDGPFLRAAGPLPVKALQDPYVQRLANLIFDPKNIILYLRVSGFDDSTLSKYFPQHTVEITPDQRLVRELGQLLREDSSAANRQTINNILESGDAKIILLLSTLVLSKSTIERCRSRQSAEGKEANLDHESIYLQNLKQATKDGLVLAQTGQEVRERAAKRSTQRADDERKKMTTTLSERDVFEKLDLSPSDWSIELQEAGVIFTNPQLEVFFELTYIQISQKNAPEIFKNRLEIALSYLVVEDLTDRLLARGCVLDGQTLRHPAVGGEIDLNPDSINGEIQTARIQVGQTRARLQNLQVIIDQHYADVQNLYAELQNSSCSISWDTGQPELSPIVEETPYSEPPREITATERVILQQQLQSYRENHERSNSSNHSMSSTAEAQRYHFRSAAALQIKPTDTLAVFDSSVLLQFRQIDQDSSSADLVNLMVKVRGHRVFIPLTVLIELTGCCPDQLLSSDYYFSSLRREDPQHLKTTQATPFFSNRNSLSLWALLKDRAAFCLLTDDGTLTPIAPSETRTPKIIITITPNDILLLEDMRNLINSIGDIETGSLLTPKLRLAMKGLIKDHNRGEQSVGEVFSRIHGLSAGRIIIACNDRRWLSTADLSGADVKSTFMIMRYISDREQFDS